MKCGVDLCELIQYVLKFSAELSAWVVGWSSVEQKSYIRPCAVAPRQQELLHPLLPHRAQDWQEELSFLPVSVFLRAQTLSLFVANAIFGLSEA